MRGKHLAFSYVRMSTEKQIKGDSLRRQLEWSQQYAAAHNLELDDGLRDIGVSAWKGNNSKRGALAAFLGMVERGEVPRGSYLLVESLDRLSRTQVMDALTLFTGILRSGINIVTMGPPEQVYTWAGINGDFGQLIITLTVMARAHEESQRKSERIRAAFANKRNLSQRGIRTNSSPPRWITATQVAKGEFSYALNDRAPLIEWIFERSAQGVGFDRIAKELNRRAEPTLKTSTRGWYFTSVSNIVCNRAAIGEYQPHEEVDGKRVPRGDAIADYYPRVVSDDLFLRAQKIRHRNRTGGRGGRYFTNLLDGMVHCAHCRGKMYIHNNSQSKNQYTYLVCANNFRDVSKGDAEPVCTKGSMRFRYEQAEQFILDNVSDFGISDVMQMRRADDDLRKRDEELASLTVKLEDIQRKEARLLTVIESEDVDNIPELLALARKRTQERSDTEALIRTLKHEREVALAKQRALDPASAVQAMREAWLSAETEDDRYGLRVRCNTAMRDFIEDIQFNSVEGSYTLILFGGARAYKFFNVSKVRKATQTPLVVDMLPLAATGLWEVTPDHAKVPLAPHLKPVNVRRGAVLFNADGSLNYKRTKPTQ
ncbi:recombinase family protein [Methylobacterium sp. NFXW15]|uniref:recombinase family protein n=1 Tax=Methylobacterium sp. NFXW15 TaxID=2819512 RepID=UPI003CEE6497